MSAVRMLSMDLAELSLDRVDKAEISTRIKSDEELAKLTVDPRLTGIERAVYLLSSGQDVQRVSIISDLPNLLRDSGLECMKRVVPKVREVLHVASIDVQLAAATAFLQILERKLVPIEEYKKTFLQTILTSVDNKNEEVATVWVETLLPCIDLLPKDVVQQNILNGEDFVLSTAVTKGQLSQTLHARFSCCQILGKVASKLDSAMIKTHVLPVVLSLCGDVEYEVRACMCQRLDIVAKGLGLELTKSRLLPLFVELSEDESPSVVSACLETTPNIICLLDKETVLNVMLPMVKGLLEKATSNLESILPTASRQFGHLYHSLLEHLPTEDHCYLVDYYKKLCRVGLSERKSADDLIKLTDVLEMFESDASSQVRQSAAYHFPAMMLFADVKVFKSDLYHTFSQLCRDPHTSVRKTMAGSFHEVSRLLGLSVSLVFPELISLLSDQDVEILKAVIPHFKEIMFSLASVGYDHFNEHKAQAIQDVVTTYLRADNVVFASPCWRVQEAMMKSMDNLHLLCCNEFIYNRVLPLLLDKLRNARARPVKVAAAKTITVLTRHLKYRAQRQEVLQILIDDFHKSESCYRRSLFVDLASSYLDTNSKQAFKDHFFDLILNMKSDKVAIVRLKMLTIFPQLKRSLKLPRDQTLRAALDAVLRQIIVYDKDSDVQHAAQQISEELASIQEGSDNSRTYRRILTKDEEDDIKKEDEEKELIAREEKEKEEEEAKAAKNSDKRNSIGGGKKDAKAKVAVNKKGLATTQAKNSANKGDGYHQDGARKTAMTAVTTTHVNSSTNKVVSTSSKTTSPTASQKVQVNSVSNSPSAVVSTSSRRGSGGNMLGTTSVGFKPVTVELPLKVKQVIQKTNNSTLNFSAAPRVSKKTGK